MANITHSMTLSTTEPNNDVGLIKVRQADDETQIFDAQITENGAIKSFSGLTPFFCLMAREVTGQGVSEEPVKTFDGEKGTLKYTVSANAMQMVGRNEAYFSFRKELPNGEWSEQFSTRSFNYTVEKSIYTQKFRDSNYWWTFKELYRLFNQYIIDGKTSWEEFLEQNREILESIDPGGVILNELLTARDGYDDLGGRLSATDDQLTSIAQTNPAMISFTFDDGFAEDKLTYSIFKEFDMVCNFAPITDQFLSRTGLNLYSKYQTEGFGVLSHSRTHPDMTTATVSQSTAYDEIANSAKFLRAAGLQVNGYVSPDSKTDDSYLQIIKDNYVYAINGAPNATANYQINAKTDPYRLYRMSLYYTEIDVIKATIDKVIDNREVLLFYDHRTGASGNHVSEAKLREVLTYIQSKTGDFKVTTLDDVAQSYFKKALMPTAGKTAISDLAPDVRKLTGTAPAIASMVPDHWGWSYHASQGDDLIQYTEDEIKVTFASSPINVRRSVQCKLPLADIDFRLAENKIAVAEFDVACSGNFENIQLDLYVDFYLAGTKIGGASTLNIPTSSNLNKQKIVFNTPVGNNFDYAHFYFLAKNLIAGTSAELVLKNIKCGFGGSEISGLPKKSTTNFGVQTNYDWSNFGYSKWYYLTFKAFNAGSDGIGDRYFSTANVPTDGLATCTKSGLYNLNFVFLVMATAVSAGSRRFAVELTVNNKSVDYSKRFIFPFDIDGLFNSTANYQLRLIKGDVLYLKIYNYATSGSLDLYSSTYPMLNVDYIGE